MAAYDARRLPTAREQRPDVVARVCRGVEAHPDARLVAREKRLLHLGETEIETHDIAAYLLEKSQIELAAQNARIHAESRKHRRVHVAEHLEAERMRLVGQSPVTCRDFIAFIADAEQRHEQHAIAVTGGEAQVFSARLGRGEFRVEGNAQPHLTHGRPPRRDLAVRLDHALVPIERVLAAALEGARFRHRGDRRR